MKSNHDSSSRSEVPACNSDLEEAEYEVENTGSPDLQVKAEAEEAEEAEVEAKLKGLVASGSLTDDW